MKKIPKSKSQFVALMQSLSAQNKKNLKHKNSEIKQAEKPLETESKKPPKVSTRRLKSSDKQEENETTNYKELVWLPAEEHPSTSNLEKEQLSKSNKSRKGHRRKSKQQQEAIAEENEEQPTYDAEQEEEETQKSRHKKERNDDTEKQVKSPRVLVYKNERLKHLVEELRSNCAKYRKELENVEAKHSHEITTLQEENEKLHMQNYEYHCANRAWKAKYERQKNKSVLLSQIRALSNENRCLQEDTDVFKSVIGRLNKELAFYQSKLELKYRSIPENLPLYSSSTSPNGESDERKDVRDLPPRRFLPLFIAYDESIAEKEDIIKDHETAIEKFKREFQAIVKENNDLHKIIGDSKEKGSISIDEWQTLHENAVLVLEENDLLHNQIDVLNRKIDATQKENNNTVEQLKSKLTSLQEDKTRLKSFISQIESHSALLTQQNTQMAELVEKYMPRDEHDASIFECKKLFEELKVNYDNEQVSLNDKLAAVEKERERLVLENTELEAENSRLKGNIKTLEESVIKSEAKIRDMQGRIQEASKTNETTAVTVEEMMELAKQVFTERESLEHSLNEQRLINEQIMTLRNQESSLVEELQASIKKMETMHRQEINKLIQRVKELEASLSSVSEKYEGELANLKDLIAEKSKVIQLLEAEKKQLEHDLETVWKATTRDQAVRSNAQPSSP